MKILIALIVLTFGLSSATEIDCEFKYTKFMKRSNVEKYTCYVQSISYDDNNPNITFINGGVHLAEQQDSNVTMFHSDKNTFQSFPRELTDDFPNIELVDIYQGGLKEITREDLEQFGAKLKILLLVHNEIRILPGNLFADTPNIMWVSFQENKIAHVEVGTFQSATNLKKLFFYHNPCHSGDADKPERLQMLITRINTECKSSQYLANQHSALTKKVEEISQIREELKTNAAELQKLLLEKGVEENNLKEENNKQRISDKKQIKKLMTDVAGLKEKCDYTEDDLNAQFSTMYNDMKNDVKDACESFPDQYVNKID